MAKSVVFMTGATGVMGLQTLKEFCKRLDRFDLRLLVRPNKKNFKKMRPFIKKEGIAVVWGDMMNPVDVREAMGNADYILHIGGMVSPLADHYPEKTINVNTGSIRIIIDEIKKREDKDEVRLAYIGSVAEISCRAKPHHWGRAGDPLIAAPYDYYAVSKILAEREVAESGLKHWVVLRQSGILDKGLLNKASDPISFHVPLRGVLEWATVEDSGRLMANMCEDGVPDEFWNKFYNIGSGKEFRLSNYKFEQLLMKALKCPPPEKVFEPGWFATRNFHGVWYTDSDKLEEILHFREPITAESYFSRMTKKLPWYICLAPLAPAFAVKMGMKGVAHKKDGGTLHWLSNPDDPQNANKIKAFFGSREAAYAIGCWEEQNLSEPSGNPVLLDHGYDETKPESELDLDDMCKAAEFRGGRCLSESVEKGTLDTPLLWECYDGHRFRLRARSVLKGGHWCPQCLPAPWQYDREAQKNKFLAQVWYDSHSEDENETYE